MSSEFVDVDVRAPFGGAATKSDDVDLVPNVIAEVDGVVFDVLFTFFGCSGESSATKSCVRLLDLFVGAAIKLAGVRLSGVKLTGDDLSAAADGWRFCVRTSSLDTISMTALVQFISEVAVSLIENCEQCMQYHTIFVFSRIAAKPVFFTPPHFA